jgi:Fe-S-cluster containining protein
MNLQEHIQRYVELVCRADRLYESVRQRHGNLMNCKPGCDDCCSVYFQLSLIEAFFISGMFRQKLTPLVRDRALARAEQASALFRQATETLAGMEGADREQMSEAAARVKVPCPLNEDHGCALYEHRPVTCRLYGIPQKIGDRVVSCPNNDFVTGGSYATVDVDEIQRVLGKYSAEFLQDLLGDGPKSLPAPLFSLPQALLTSFDREFFETLRGSLR